MGWVSHEIWSRGGLHAVDDNCFHSCTTTITFQRQASVFARSEFSCSTRKTLLSSQIRHFHCNEMVGLGWRTLRIWKNVIFATLRCCFEQSNPGLRYMYRIPSQKRLLLWSFVLIHWNRGGAFQTHSIQGVHSAETRVDSAFAVTNFENQVPEKLNTLNFWPIWECSFFQRTGESPYWEMGGYMDMYDEYMVDNVKQGLEYVRLTLFFTNSWNQNKFPCWSKMNNTWNEVVHATEPLFLSRHFQMGPNNFWQLCFFHTLPQEHGLEDQKYKH